MHKDIMAAYRTLSTKTNVVLLQVSKLYLMKTQFQLTKAYLAKMSCLTEPMLHLLLEKLSSCSC